MSLTEVLKRNNAFQLIKSDIDHNMLSHSYMIVGDDSLVIDEFLRLVKMLVYCDSHEACMHCRECIRVLDGNNTNIYDVVPYDGKVIKVDEIGAMIEDTYIAPYEDNYKVYTIARGEIMNPQAQNKLLKTLEEPIGKKLMLIATTNESNMLDTIKSRCKKIYISPLSLDDIISILDEDVDIEDVKRAYKLSGGRLSLIKEMLSSGNNLALEYDKVVDMLSCLTNSKNLPLAVSKLGGKMNNEKAKSFINMLELVLKDTMMGLNPHLIEMGFNRRAIANIEDLISSARERLNFNCGAHAVIDYVLFGILEVKYKCR